MYTEYYGFRMKPFQLTPDPEFLYLSSAHKKALAYLTYGIEDRSGFVAITGEIGAGKTTLIRVLMKGLKNDMVVARINNTLATSQQFLEMVLREFELDYENKSKTQLLDTLNDFLIAQYAKKKHAILIIDEAQNLTVPLLEEVRMLSNLETDKSKLIQIIFVGQPKLREKLGRPELEQLRQRITVSYHLPPLSRDEVEGYINHRINLVGPPGAVTFTADAIDEIYAFSRGIPRLVNVVCDGALLAGFVAEQRTITADIIKDTVSDLGQIECSTSPTSDVGSAGAGETREVKELKQRVHELRSRMEELDRKNRESAPEAVRKSDSVEREEKVSGSIQDELRAAREETNREKARLNDLRRQLEQEKEQVDMLAEEHEKRVVALQERDESLQQRETSLTDKEAFLEQERIRILSLEDDLVKRETALVARLIELEGSSPKSDGRRPDMSLEIFLLERDDRMRSSSIDGMTVRGLSVRGFAEGTELLDALRREKGSGSYPVVVIDAMEAGDISPARMDYREIVKRMNDEFPTVRKMITTAYPYYSLRREAMMTGVDYVMAKPDAREMNAGLFDLMFLQYIDELTFCIRRVYDQSRLFLEEWHQNGVSRLND